MKKTLSALLALMLTLSALFPAPAGAESAPGELKVQSACLMEKESGRILYEYESHKKLEPASVTKVMTMLLVMEALDSGRLAPEQQVAASAHAVSMGGSQIWLRENERMTVHELLKAVAVVSANDCAVALAEAVAGSEAAFVERMNQRAVELGMADTNFCNATGLPSAGHLTSAHDIAVMSRELVLRHPEIREYTTIWMDSLRDGAFQLSNTNKLVRFYEGATGLKTGYTASAHYCLAATAERDGMELIATVMGAATSDDRFEGAKTLLNFGFSNYALVNVYPDQAVPPVAVELGEAERVQPVLSRPARVLLERDKAAQLSTSITLSPKVSAPVEQGQILGRMEVRAGDEVLDSIPLTAERAVERLTAPKLFRSLLRRLFMGD